MIPRHLLSFRTAGSVRCLVRALAHVTVRRSMPHASYRFSQNRSSNTSRHQCETSCFTTITPSTGIRVANSKYSSTTHPCRCCGIRVGTSGGTCWVSRSASRRPSFRAANINTARARGIYLFRSEYIFDLERAVIVETPQLGYAAYLFSKSSSVPEFLAIYASTSREDILQNRSNVSENLGFLCRLIHGASPRNWLKE